MTAITRLRRERARRRPAGPMPRPSLRERADERLLNAAVHEIARRGGELTIHGETTAHELEIADRDRAAGMMLLRAQGWRYYSRRAGSRFATLAYLYGTDDAGPWAVRVPGTVQTVAEALAWITPAEVTRALAAGKRVRRQGDVYAIETTSGRDGSGELPEGHQWRPDTRYLVHRPADGRRHRPVPVPWPVRFVTQRVYGMGRNSGRADGD
ncbi:MULTISPECIES: hypothetical protein [Streptomyces]|uniref:hypothetical protein n=1 Tax=Streptomyces TaxID=1883 RepID=UPI0004CD3968|nr:MULTISPECIES: hypothetical protein [Streptomyces]KOT51159.1 hypothetical protein ADK43_32710 [Streptomyces rimosus subsp. rimosus]